MSNYVFAIDQGTTSSRAILFDDTHASVAIAQKEFDQHFPHSGWIEHDSEDIWETTLSTCREAIAKAGAGPSKITSMRPIGADVRHWKALS